MRWFPALPRVVLRGFGVCGFGAWVWVLGGWLCPQLISILLVVALGETLVFWEERCFVILLIAATCFISKIVAGCRDIKLPET